MNITVPYFDNLEVELHDENGSLEGQEAQQALSAFLRLRSADRLRDSRHIFAYFEDFRASVECEDGWDDTKAYPEQAPEIWRHVTPGLVFLEQGNGEDDAWYVIMEAECDWEIEHGLMMVWRNGTTLCKVGGYDGHLTNADAYGDSHLSDVVYQATNPGFTTSA